MLTFVTGETVQGTPFRHQLLLGQAPLHALEAAQLRLPIVGGAPAPAHGDDPLRGELVKEMFGTLLQGGEGPLCNRAYKEERGKNWLMLGFLLEKMFGWVSNSRMVRLGSLMESGQARFLMGDWPG